MSGISAIFRTDGQPVERHSIDQMTAAMAYRGPDGIDAWCSGPVGLGHCMMHTTEESLEEHQPLGNQDNSVILIMDGYLTNWEELRQDLLARGAQLRNRSDAELVLRAYETWGEECPSHIDGEYAFVIWDAHRREVFCARDHQGLRPLLYHWDGTVLVIASDLAAVLAALPQTPPLNHGFMAEVLGNQWFTSDETVWSGIKRVLPAHSMRLGPDGPRFAEYWTLPTEVSITYKRDEDYFEHYREMFADCVRRASRTHRPLAFEVSGGLDSSSIYCMAHHLQQQGRLPAPEIRGYTLAGPEGTGSDEVEYARIVARHLGVQITEVPLFLPELDWFTRQSAADRDIPTYPNGAMSIGLERALVNDGCRVAINGTGGDQWLDGRPNYYNQLLTTGDWRGLAASFREDVAGLGFKRAAELLIRHGLGPMAPHSARSTIRRLKGPDQQSELDALYWLSPEMKAEITEREARYFSSLPADPHLRYKLQKLKFPYLALGFDLLSRQRSQSGMEARSPMLSRAFIEFSAATPERTRLRGGLTKFIHRQALAGLIPEEIANRRTKAEFGTAFTRHNRAITKLSIEQKSQSLAQISDPVGLAKLIEKYCSAPIDEKAIWEVWGFYACATLLKTHSEL